MLNYMKLIIFLKFTNKNIFVNIFEEYENKRVPVIFKTLKSQKIENQQKKIKISDRERTTNFIDLLGLWLQLKYKSQINGVILVFNNFGNKYKKFQQIHSYELTQRRQIFVDIITQAKIPINIIIDRTGVPFGECKNQRVRRKKRKHFLKINQ